VLGFIHICLFLFSSLDGELDGRVERRERWGGILGWWMVTGGSYIIFVFFCNLSFVLKGACLFFFSKKQSFPLFPFLYCVSSFLFFFTFEGGI